MGTFRYSSVRICTEQPSPYLCLLTFFFFFFFEEWTSLKIFPFPFPPHYYNDKILIKKSSISQKTHWIYIIMKFTLICAI